MKDKEAAVEPSVEQRARDLANAEYRKIVRPESPITSWIDTCTLLAKRAILAEDKLEEAVEENAQITHLFNIVVRHRDDSNDAREKLEHAAGCATG